MPEHSEHYCIVMYKCNINVSGLFYIQAPVTCRHFSEVPLGNWL